MPRDLADAFLQPTVIVEEGDPAELVLKTARDHGCDLTMAGIATDEAFGRLLLGGTVDALIRSTALPLRVVKNRTHGRYDHLLAATDFDDKIISMYARGMSESEVTSQPTRPR